MRTCPVCDQPVERLGPMGDDDMGGLVVHTDDETYVVHAVCLIAFGDLLGQLDAELVANS